MNTFDQQQISQTLQAYPPLAILRLSSRLFLYTLVLLTRRSEEYGFLWFWNITQRPLYLGHIFKALQVALTTSDMSVIQKKTPLQTIVWDKALIQDIATIADATADMADLQRSISQNLKNFNSQLLLADLSDDAMQIVEFAFALESLLSLINATSENNTQHAEAYYMALSRIIDLVLAIYKDGEHIIEYEMQCIEAQNDGTKLALYPFSTLKTDTSDIVDCMTIWCKQMKAYPQYQNFMTTYFRCPS